MPGGVGGGSCEASPYPDWLARKSRKSNSYKYRIFNYNIKNLIEGLERS
jgi:hypothetical protein